MITTAPIVLMRRPAPSTGSSQRVNGFDAQGISHHVISETLVTWLSHIASHGGAPRWSSTGPRNRDRIITVGYSTSSRIIADFQSGVITVVPFSVRTVVANGVVEDTGANSLVRLDRSSPSTSSRSLDCSQRVSCFWVRKRTTDSHSPPVGGGKSDVPSKPG